jgi:hydrogenase maturation protease
MSVSAKPRPLIIGIGNPLRSDDSLGWAVVEELLRDTHSDPEHPSSDGSLGCDIDKVHQLTPELAQQVALAGLVIMVDASYEREPGKMHIRPLSHPAQPGAIGTHHTTPEELAALTIALYGQCPPVVVITMTGEDFELGEQLSPLIAQRLPLVCAAVRQVCADYGTDENVGNAINAAER